ncbi:hypothetical protein GCM10023263_33110 [Phytohabitans rumicis]
MPTVHQVGELLLERGDLRTLHNHATAQHSYGGLDLGITDDWLCCGNELIVHRRH